MLWKTRHVARSKRDSVHSGERQSTPRSQLWIARRRSPTSPPVGCFGGHARGGSLWKPSSSSSHLRRIAASLARSLSSSRWAAGVTPRDSRQCAGRWLLPARRAAPAAAGQATRKAVRSIGERPENTRRPVFNNQQSGQVPGTRGTWYQVAARQTGKNARLFLVFLSTKPLDEGDRSYVRTRPRGP